MMAAGVVLLALACAWWLVLAILASQPADVDRPEADPPAWMVRQLYDDTR